MAAADAADAESAVTAAVRRMPTQLGGPVRICIVDVLDGGVRHDLIALSPADARRVARELWEAADAADIETTGGVPPVHETEVIYDND